MRRRRGILPNRANAATTSAATSSFEDTSTRHREGIAALRGWSRSPGGHRPRQGRRAARGPRPPRNATPSPTRSRSPRPVTTMPFPLKSWYSVPPIQFAALRAAASTGVDALHRLWRRVSPFGVDRVRLQSMRSRTGAETRPVAPHDRRPPSGRSTGSGCSMMTQAWGQSCSHRRRRPAKSRWPRAGDGFADVQHQVSSRRPRPSGGRWRCGGRVCRKSRAWSGPGS